MSDTHRDRPTAQQLQYAAKQRRRQKRQCFDVILDKVYTRINAKAKLDWVRVLYEVPPFVVGIPPYDVEECVRFLVRALKKDGYIVEPYGCVLYISWDKDEKAPST